MNLVLARRIFEDISCAVNSHQKCPPTPIGTILEVCSANNHPGQSKRSTRDNIGL